MPKYASESRECGNILSSTTVMKGSHLVPFYSTCINIRICILAYLFSNNTIRLESHFFIYIKKKELSEEMLRFHCATGCIFRNDAG